MERTRTPAAEELRSCATAPSRTSRFAWAASLTWGYQALLLVVGLWLTRFLLGRLGEAVLGWWTQALVLIGYLGLLDFGLNSLLPREVAAAVGQAGGWRGASDLPGIIARFTRFLLWQLPLVVAVALSSCLALVRTDLVPVPVTLVLLATAVLVFPFRVGSGVLAGLQDFRFAGFAQVAAYLTGLGVTVAAVAAGCGVVGLVLGWVVQAWVMSALVCARLAVCYWPALPRFREVLAAQLPMGLFVDGTWAWLASVGGGLAGTADLLVIGWLYPPEVVFQFACSVKLTLVIGPFVMTLCPAVLPGLAELRASRDGARVERASLAYTEFILGLSGLFGCVLLATNAGFVGWWVGPSRYLGDQVLWAAVAAMNLRHWLNAVSVTLFCLHRERPLWQLTLLDGILCFAATAVCVSWGGPGCAPLGVGVTTVAITLPALLGLLVQEGTLSLRAVLLPVTVWAVLYAAAAVAAVAAGRLLRPDGLSGLAVVGAAVAVLYAAVLVGPTMRSRLGEYLRPRFRQLIRQHAR
jgi:hypothetical protein